MNNVMSAPMREFMNWVVYRPRTYAEVLEVWRSSCPRLTVWEDALIAGLVQVEAGKRLDEAAVTLTQQGCALVAGAA